MAKLSRQARVDEGSDRSLVSNLPETLRSQMWKRSVVFSSQCKLQTNDLTFSLPLTG